jgi:beta-lactamase regulating signal transducer with metallopeptidase domain
MTSAALLIGLVGAVGTSAGVVGAAVIVLRVVSRFWRRADAALWHQIWTTVASVSTVMPFVAAAGPLNIRLSVPSAVDLPFATVASSTRLDGALAMAGGIYLLGVGVALVRLIAGLCIVARLVARSSVPDGLPADRLYESLGRAALRCRVNDRLQVPITVGWIAPLVLLPPTWILWAPARRDAIVRHELAHTARRDYVWNLIAAIQHAVYWFSPAAWVIARRIRLSAELACDQQAASIVGSAAYASVLVETARDATQNGTRAGILAVSAITELEARVEALVAPTPPTTATSRRLRLFLVGVVALGLAAMSTVRVTWAAPHATGFSPDHRAAHQAQHQAQHQTNHPR